MTLGSDAHQADHVGADFDAAIEAMRAAGLKCVTTFEQRRARLVRI